MKRILLLALGLSSFWTSGCCWYYSRHACWDDCYVGEDSCNDEYREPRRKARRKRRRERNRCEVADCGGDCCCGSCCGSCCGPICGSCCDMGCSTCGPNGCNVSVDGGPVMGGCPSGNCNVQTTNGSGQMYGGLPFDANSGWTLQSTTSHPAGEPVQAPPSSATPISPRAQGWVPASTPMVTPSSAPSPGPVPPVSYSR